MEALDQFPTPLLNPKECADQEIAADIYAVATEDRQFIVINEHGLKPETFNPLGDSCAGQALEFQSCSQNMTSPRNGLPLDFEQYAM
jgi:hypothetical protein